MEEVQRIIAMRWKDPGLFERSWSRASGAGTEAVVRRD